MYYELSKPEKKIARQIIEKGLQHELKTGIKNLEAIISEWKLKNKDHHDTYHLLYKSITDFDKGIARRYDRMTGSNYIWIIAGQLADGVITKQDLEPFNEEVKNI